MHPALDIPFHSNGYQLSTLFWIFHFRQTKVLFDDLTTKLNKEPALLIWKKLNFIYSEINLWLFIKRYLKSIDIIKIVLMFKHA